MISTACITWDGVFKLLAALGGIASIVFLTWLCFQLVDGCTCWQRKWQRRSDKKYVERLIEEEMVKYIEMLEAKKAETKQCRFNYNDVMRLRSGHV